jgi:hypothetical protein
MSITAIPSTAKAGKESNKTANKFSLNNFFIVTPLWCVLFYLN